MEPILRFGIFGADAVARALADLGAALGAATGRLLAQHEILGCHRREDGGRWSARFKVLAGGLPCDAAETCAATKEVGHKLAHDLPMEVFGTGTGMRMPFALAALLDRGIELAQGWLYGRPGPIGAPAGG